MSEAAEVGQTKRGLSRSVVPRVLNALVWLVLQPVEKRGGRGDGRGRDRAVERVR